MSLTTITSTPPRREQCQPPAPAGDVATVIRFFSAWAEGDVSRIETLVDPRIVLGPIVGLLYEREVYRGRRGTADAFRETAERWDRFEMAVESAQQRDRHVVASVRVGLEKHGMSSEAVIKVVCRLRDGRVAIAVGDDAR